MQDPLEILRRFLDHQRLPLAPKTVEMVIDGILSAHKYLAVALSGVLGPSASSEENPAPKAPAGQSS